MGWQLNSNISRERVRILIDEAVASASVAGYTYYNFKSSSSFF